MTPMTDPAQLPLRDIHLPDPVSWWPLAPAWWLLLTVIILLFMLIRFLIQRRRKHKGSAIYIAKQELDTIKNNFNISQDKVLLVKQLSVLIRRVSVSIFERQETASLTGQAWLQFLDQYSVNDEFSNGTGRVLIEGPYRARPDYDSADLINIVSNWIDTISSSKKIRSHD